MTGRASRQLWVSNINQRSLASCSSTSSVALGDSSGEKNQVIVPAEVDIRFLSVVLQEEKCTEQHLTLSSFQTFKWCDFLRAMSLWVPVQYFICRRYISVTGYETYGSFCCKHFILFHNTTNIYAPRAKIVRDLYKYLSVTCQKMSLNINRKYYIYFILLCFLNKYTWNVSSAIENNINSFILCDLHLVREPSDGWLLKWPCMNVLMG